MVSKSGKEKWEFNFFYFHPLIIDFYLFETLMVVNRITFAISISVSAISALKPHILKKKTMCGRRGGWGWLRANKKFLILEGGGKGLILYHRPPTSRPYFVRQEPSLLPLFRYLDLTHPPKQQQQLPYLIKL